MKVNGMTSSGAYYGAKPKTPSEKLKDFTRGKKDSVEISNTAKVYDKIDNFLNLNAKNRLDLSDLSESEKEEFFKMLHALIKRGIIGYEYLEVNGKKEKHFIVNEIGNERIYGARKWRDKNYFKPKR